MVIRSLAVTVVLSCLASLPSVRAARPVGLVEPDWPQFRGPHRDAVSAETGLLQEWPDGGPRELWGVNDIGRGYSSPIIVGDRLFITGDVGDDLVIAALGPDGTRKWQATNGRAWRRRFAGARGTCTYVDGKVYNINGHGRAVCLNAETGAELWAVDMLARFEGETIHWGISECPLVVGDRVIVTPGGKKALMAALDCNTGETVWQTKPLHFMREHQFGGKPVNPPEADIDKAGYASPILFEVGGRRLIASASARHLFCVDADAGTLVWTRSIYARFEVIGAMPVLCGDALFYAAPDAFGGRLFRVAATADKVTVTESWEVPTDNCHGSFVCVNGRIYGSGYRRSTPWVCIDPASGTVEYQKDDLAIGSCAYADGRLYALSQRGLCVLLEPTVQGFVERGRIQLVGGAKNDVWSHPVICNGRLYLRYHGELRCYDIRR